LTDCSGLAGGVRYRREGSPATAKNKNTEQEIQGRGGKVPEGGLACSLEREMNE